MEKVDRQAIEGLFDKLAKVERRSPPRDDAAEAFIGDKIARQPHAPYYMAQTIVVQEQALNAAQARIEELEREGDRSGGMMSSIFGGREPQPAGSVPRTGRTRQAASEPARDAQQRPGGGFLAGAAQTAMGVTGGILLGNLIAGMFGADQAKAAEPQADSASDDGDAQDGDADDGPDDGGFGDDIGFGDFDV